MKRNSLGWWLAAINVLIVLVVAAGVSWVAIGLLQRLADGQQQVRVQLAGADARAELARIGEDTLSGARILAERPTLRRLLQQRELTDLPPVLQRFCAPAGLDACAILEGDTVLATTSTTVPWMQMMPAVREQGERFMFAAQGTPDAYLGATASLGDAVPGGRVVVVHVLNDSFARRLVPQEGVEIRLRNYRNFNNAPADAFTNLHTTALADGRYAVAHIRELGLYAASHPVFSATGEGIVLIETRLPTAQTDRDVRALRIRLLWLAAFLGVIAFFGSVLLGRRVTGPTEALTAAAERLGQGDFTTSIPQGGPAEIGKLARTMDDMRRNLIDLTGTLRQREAEAQAVLAGIVEGVYAVDGERRITYMNEQAARLLGVKAADAIGRFCGDVLKPRCIGSDSPCNTSCPIVRARRQGSAAAVEHLVTAAGERRMVITSARPVDSLQVQVLRDETELEAVRRARDTVLANVSHEFRTPLAAQLASIELLRDGLRTQPPEQLEELVLSLERGSLRLTQLIDNLLESVRIEAGQRDIRQQNIELSDVIEDAISTVDALLRQRSQRIERAVGEELSLPGDGVRLTQVFVNLLANACKFAPAGSVIRVGAERIGEQIRAWVDDAGPGLPAGAQENVFERFSRGGVEPAPSGMGLGLSISRSIVERHGGTLSASRTADGYTRFTLTLPAETGG
ncbi:MAG TPA: ATP-binding protein [Steroidobacteraceae bacterium]|nr:ATP-binding protein [Steroidobacteraceae bacterium]